MDLWTLWWVWIVAALVLSIIEVFVPVFVFLGMAVGAVVVGIGLAFGLLGWIATLPVLLIIFAAASVIAAIALRSVIGVRKGQVKVWDRDIND
ncbi:NfeD family protein [Tateyamaria sp. SN3-11]|uniref:NfeD family protein n=1 Tax=Tateyamaria sp. SN3-11 TaxID=3092147 RepID=UPI0039E8153C